MNRNDPDYWFYLEPYTFLFHEGDAFVVYNTLNGAYIDCSLYPGIQDILQELYVSDTNYCVGLHEEQLRQETLRSFIREIRNTFSGDMVKNTHGTAPFIFKPILRLYSHPGDLKAKQENLLGLSSLLYLHEVAFYLGNPCRRNCPDCKRYYKQFYHCTCPEEEQVMTFDDYEKIIAQLELCQLDKLCLIPGENADKELVQKLLFQLQRSPLKKEVILHDTSSPDVTNDFLQAGFAVKIMTHLTGEVSDLQTKLNAVTDKKLTRVFIITDESDLKQLDLLKIPDDVPYEVIPYFNGFNLPFFEKFVYNELDDILREPVEKQAIFRRQVLNENFFGELSVFPSGQVYANPNDPSIGHVLHQKLTEIVYREISDSKAWLKTREEGACGKCVNKYLCPSPSNYEVVINKSDLCHIRSCFEFYN